MDIKKIIENPDFGIELLQELKKARAEKRQLEKENANLSEQITRIKKEKAETFADPGMSVTIIAKSYGMSAVSFNSLLHELGIQYKVDGTWILYQKYAAKGYTKSEIHYTKGRHLKIHTRWTQKGRLFLQDILSEYGFFPIREVFYEA